MKICVSEDEWYPVWDFVDSEKHGWELDIPIEKVKEWKEVFVAFDRVQAEIQAEYTSQVRLK